VSATLIVIAERCNNCSKERHPRDIMRQPGGVKVCHYCWQKHLYALNVLATATPPDACQECGTSYELLEARAGGDTSMVIHQKDGIYQVLCHPCDRAYVQKRRDLFRGTEFAHKRGL
jgi:hypothetical protein